MRRAALAFALLAAAWTLDVPPSFAVMELATVRGRAVDEAGNGVPDVKVVFDFTGESRVKISREAITDKKGGFVRVGLKAGHYKITLTKEGYRTHVTERDLGPGDILPIGDLLVPKLQEAAPAEAAGPAPGAAPPALPEDATAKVKEAYAKAAEAAKAGQTDDAIAAYKALIEMAPNVGAAYYNLAVLYEGQKNWKAAETELQKVTELQPDKSDGHIALAAVRELDGRGGEAVEGLLKVASTFETDARFQYALGTTCLDTGRSADAVAAFTKVGTLDPSNVEIHYWLGTIAVGNNDIPTATAELQKYIAAQGQNPQNLDTAKGLLTALKPKK